MAEFGISFGAVCGDVLPMAEEAEFVLDQGDEVKLFEEGFLEAWRYLCHYLLLLTTLIQSDLSDNIEPLYSAIRDIISYQSEPYYITLVLSDISCAYLCSCSYELYILLQEWNTGVMEVTESRTSVIFGWKK